MVRRGPKRLVLYTEMLNRGKHTRNGHDWNPMLDMELESLREFVFLEWGSRKGGFGRTPRTPPPPWLRA